MSQGLESVRVHRNESWREIFYRPGPSDERTLTQIFKSGHYNLARFERFAELQALAQAKQNQGLRPLILDGGANIGAAAVFFHLLFPTAHFICVEPVETTMRVLKANLAGISSTPVLAALASESGELRVYPTEAGQFDSYRASNAPDRDLYAPQADVSAAPMVKAITVPDLLRLAPADTFPFIAKFDIEGGERDLFSQNTDWIDRFPVIICEPHDWMMPRSRCAAPMLRRLSSRSRDFLILEENIVSIAHDLACP